MGSAQRMHYVLLTQQTEPHKVVIDKDVLFYRFIVSA